MLKNGDGTCLSSVKSYLTKFSQVVCWPVREHKLTASAEFG